MVIAAGPVNLNSFEGKPELKQTQTNTPETTPAITALIAITILIITSRKKKAGISP